MARHAESEHARLIGLGTTAGRYIARIGAEGAREDHAARRRLAAIIHSADPLLIAPPLPPDCPDIPSWVTNPIAPIDAAYAKSADLQEMFALYGGRLDLAGAGANAEASCMLAARLTQHVAQRLGAGQHRPLPGADVAPMKLADMPPGDARYAGDGPRRPPRRTTWRTRGF